MYIRNVFIDNHDGTHIMALPSGHRIIIDSKQIPAINELAKNWNYCANNVWCFRRENGNVVKYNLRHLIYGEKIKLKHKNKNPLDFRKENLAPGYTGKTYFNQYRYEKINNNLYYMIWDHGLVAIFDKKQYEKIKHHRWIINGGGNGIRSSYMRMSLGQFLLDTTEKVFLKVNDHPKMIDYRKNNLIIQNDVKIKNGVVRIYFKNGKVGKMDITDYEKLKHIRIGCSEFKKGYFLMFYIIKCPNRKTIFVARKILGIEFDKSKSVTYADGDSLNLRRDNLIIK